MTFDDLEEALIELFPNGYKIDIDDNDEIVIHTGLCQDEDGELMSIDDSEEYDGEGHESYDESDDYD